MTIDIGVYLCTVVLAHWSAAWLNVSQRRGDAVRLNKPARDPARRVKHVEQV